MSHNNFPNNTEAFPQYQDRNRWAIIIGISKYKHFEWNLKYADHDADELYQLLTSMEIGGFAPEYIDKYTNEAATTRNLQTSFRSFLKKPSPDDLVLIYVSCHGTPDPEIPQNIYLVTHDTDPDNISGTALPLYEIENAIKHTLKAKRVVVFADTGHSAALLDNSLTFQEIRNHVSHNQFQYQEKIMESIPTKDALLNRYLIGLHGAGEGTALLASAEINELTFEGADFGGGHGVFTYFLLEGMRGSADKDKNEVITVGELFDYVVDNVRKVTNYKQNPVPNLPSSLLNLPIAVISNFDSSKELKSGLDITKELELTSDEMISGTKKNIFTERENIIVKIPGGVEPGKRIRVKGKGEISNETDERGDLYLLVAQSNEKEEVPSKGIEESTNKASAENSSITSSQVVGDFSILNSDSESSSKISESDPEEEPVLERKLHPVDVPKDDDIFENGQLFIITIGINDYVHWPKLNNAVQDALGLQQVLVEELGFSAPIPPLLDKEATQLAISSLVNDKLYNFLGENDSLVIFFAGHGTTRVRQIGKREIETGYLVPFDAGKSWGDCIEIGQFLENLSAVPARHVLVILDSCHSGFALGQAMQSFRDTVHYKQDLSRRFSRRVITSARKDQVALDGGPVKGHSLFTGTLIDGFKLGKADLDGNGLISSSELGLFIQQQVAQSSESSQTPDFGAFKYDERGEMVIPLRDQSFSALTNRAFSSSNNGEFSTFKEIVQKILAVNPSSPISLYFKFRLMMLEYEVEQARAIVNELINLSPLDRDFPFTRNELWDLEDQLYRWNSVLTIKEEDIPFEVLLLIETDDDEFQVARTESDGEKKIIPIGLGTRIQFQITNNLTTKAYVYMFEFDSRSFFQPVTLWSDESTISEGLKPGGTQRSYIFRLDEDPGICEFRFFISPNKVTQMTFLPSVGTRSVRRDEDYNWQGSLKTKSLFYRLKKT